ncbi:TlpA family protein disulfide reductase [Poseidonibacter lekithochrous]|uniref:Redoxin family protein n=1 Tax=Poseidonibacter ostreae TaxID=2654171 RepID=A0A6L4WN29_9BACT|nr:MULTISPECIES: TlpA disulfide reductase family protein [Arcobacteraceae]MAC83146.1 thioredoxin [Arcobacter sp.]KAB7881953.1 redoxin family protein [Poseidonibacter ostreae]KAB7884347.1 redoxin family protein [Poseidonibacter ostreae]KAB7886613.1 redoxin family protein [Poseidonibacter ostreae]MBU3015596.1 TlpA family protein disulfide reductase [Poseidonibacter lekithochrous]|tara:strand:+ start:329 stop:931 length:603 start_codon:yes stop_codon:yes gene_type:complete
MKTNYFFAVFLTSLFLFTGCDSKSEIDDSLIANTKKNTPYVKKFVSKTFKLTTTDGKIIELTSTKEGLDFKDYKGKKAILVDFFATWCPPCIKGLPILKELREKYKDDFEIISVLYEKEEDKPTSEIIDFIKKYDITYPITVGEENFKLAKDLDDVQRIPELFLFSKDGKFVKKFLGETDLETYEIFLKMAIGENKLEIR